MKKSVLIIVLVVLLLSLLSCEISESYTVLSAKEKNSQSVKSMTYEKFNGWRKYTVDVGDGEELVINVNFVTNDGKLNVYIAKDDDKTNAVYSGKDVVTSSFTVTLKESGKYTICVEGDNHSGSYDFNW